MYLAKIHISSQKANNPYDWHDALWKLFPGRPDEKRQFLFRVEHLDKQTGAQILLQTPIEPAHSSDDARCLACKPVVYCFEQGQNLRFRLRCNPIKAIKDERKGTVTRNGTVYTRSVKVPLIDEEEQQSWLAGKLQAAGAELLAVTVIQESPLYFRKSKEKRSGKIQPVLFEGILKVTDVESFQKKLQEGIGPAKAFGMGLLSLAKP